MNRRDLLKQSAFAASALLLGGRARAVTDNELPNILWITSEDHGPEMGCYGDKFATTPNVDALAKMGMIFEFDHELVRDR